jgi:hypothetical protein
MRVLSMLRGGFGAACSVLRNLGDMTERICCGVRDSLRDVVVKVVLVLDREAEKV